METVGLAYADMAIGISLVAGVIGFVYSIFDALVLANENDKATWQPVAYSFGFTLLWPALSALFPFFIFQDYLTRSARAEKARAVRLRQSTSYVWAERFVLGVGLAIMVGYVAGFFL